MIFKLWYIFGALLGGAPLAQGTVHLLLKDQTANRLSVLLIFWGYWTIRSNRSESLHAVQVEVASA